MARTEINSIVFIVDDDASVCKGLARLMKSAGYVTETFTSAHEFLDSGRFREVPGCVLLDVSMPGLSGLDLQQELKTSAPPIPVIFITGHGDIPMVVQAMKDGAHDFLTKPVADEVLLHAVQKAILRNVADRARHAELSEIKQRAGTLTPREHEVMMLVVSGRLNKQVAAELGTVEKTIKVHRARVMEKMAVASIAELVRVVEKLETSSNQIKADPLGSSHPAVPAPATAA